MSGSGGARSRSGWWRSRSTWLLVVFAVLAVGVAVVLQDTSRTTAPLDPDNPGSQGTRALSRVAADAVEVATARSADALASLGPVAAVIPIEATGLAVAVVAELAGRPFGLRLEQEP